MAQNKYLAVAAVLLAISLPSYAEENKNIDPYEGYNRFMFQVNDKADKYIMTPLARGYRAVTPSPVRTGVRNFFGNLRDVVSFGSNLLRLDIKRASEDFVRVGFNTTFGLGGLLDVAGAAGIPDNKNTLGDTFASWGWKNSNYFVYPLLGPSTVRDSLGNTLTSVYPIENTFIQGTGARLAARALTAVDKREQMLDLTDGLDDAALDRYAYVRDFYMGMRAKQVGGDNASEVEDINIDELVDPNSSAAGDTDDTAAAENTDVADMPNNADNTADSTASDADNADSNVAATPSETTENPEDTPTADNPQ